MEGTRTSRCLVIIKQQNLLKLRKLKLKQRHLYRQVGGVLRHELQSEDKYDEQAVDEEEEETSGVAQLYQLALDLLLALGVLLQGKQVLVDQLFPKLLLPALQLCDVTHLQVVLPVVHRGCVQL